MQWGQGQRPTIRQELFSQFQQSPGLQKQILEYLNILKQRRAGSPPHQGTEIIQPAVRLDIRQSECKAQPSEFYLRNFQGQRTQFPGAILHFGRGLITQQLPAERRKSLWGPAWTILGWKVRKMNLLSSIYFLNRSLCSSWKLGALKR